MPPAAPAIFTSAPGTMAPLVSCTVPVIAPVSCAHMGVVAKAKSRRRHAQTNRDFIFSSVVVGKDMGRADFRREARTAPFPSASLAGALPMALLFRGVAVVPAPLRQLLLRKKRKSLRNH